MFADTPFVRRHGALRDDSPIGVCDVTAGLDWCDGRSRSGS